MFILTPIIITAFWIGVYLAGSRAVPRGANKGFKFSYFRSREYFRTHFSNAKDDRSSMLAILGIGISLFVYLSFPLDLSSSVESTHRTTN